MAPNTRPHVGEPLALDLLNTVWIAGGEHVDFLAEPANVAHWLGDNAIDVPASTAAGAALAEARAAILAMVTDRDAAAAGALNRVLAHGSLRVGIDEDGAIQRAVEADDDAWYPAVLAATNLVELLEQHPTRIRRCDHPDCVLWFLDTSRNGTRRWHSMTTCGNRAKAQRHYARSRAITPAVDPDQPHAG